MPRARSASAKRQKAGSPPSSARSWLWSLTSPWLAVEEVSKNGEV
jgi:hypothetical protein